MFSKKLFGLIALLTIASTLLVACGGGATPVPATKAPEPTKPPEKVTFIFGAQGEPICLDPPVITDGITGRVLNQTHEGLVRFKGSTTDVEPALAEKWDMSADSLVWTFYLRKGVKFHDGTPFNADAVVKNWDYWAHTKNPLHKQRLDDGRSFDYYEGQFGGFDDGSIITKVEAKDENTVVFTLKEPQGPFLNNLAMFVFVFTSPAWLEKAGKDYCAQAVGTGPFKFVEWQKDQVVKLAKFADYWDKAKMPKVDEIIIRNIKDNSARLNALKAGEVHGVEGLEPDSVKALKADPNYQILLRPPNTTGYVSFNYHIKEFQDIKVRQAIAMAINRKAIVDAFYGGLGLVAKTMQPPALWAYNTKIPEYEYSPDKAKALLAEAGFKDGLSTMTWEDGTKGPLEFWYMPVSRPYYPSPKDIAEAIAADLAKANIKVELKTADWAVYLDKGRKGQLPFNMLGWTGDNGDPDNFLCYFFCLDAKEQPQARNSFFPDKEVSDLLKKGAMLTKQDERRPLYNQAEQLMYDRALRLFIAHNQPPLALSAKVKGYIPHPTGTEYYNTIEIVK